MQKQLPALFAVAAIVLSSVPARANDDLPLFKVLPEFGDEADFGIRVAISGNIVIIGAPSIAQSTPSPPPPGVGSAYLFDISDLANPTRIKFHADDGVAGDGFGISVGISGTTVIVGATGALDSPDRSGAAYLFDISDPANPAQIAKLISNDAVEVYSGLVALSGTTAIIGVVSGNLVYLFDISDPENPTKVELRPGTGHAGELFGSSAAVSGTKVIVGAVSGPDDSDNSGSAFLFDVSDPANPTRIELLPDNGIASDFYGTSVAINGATAIVGAPNVTNIKAGPSSAYLFDITNPASPTQIKLGVDGLTSGHLFGISVAICGTSAIVGVPAFFGAIGNSAYLFDVSDPANPTQVAKFISDNGEADDAFGSSVGTNGKVAVVGAPLDDDAGENAGAAYLFGVDTDGDGLLDDWETKGIPYTDAGGIEQRYMLPGADRFHKDLYVEVDAMMGFGFHAAAQLDVIQAFANAPQDLVGNPDGLDGITLHLQVDEEDLQAVGFPNTWVDFQAFKAAHFGIPMVEQGNTALLEAKAKAYRYCVFGESYGMPPSPSSGLAEIPGNDFMVTLGLWAPVGGTVDQQAGTFMHELGHTLGLTHLGPLKELNEDERGAVDSCDDRYNRKPNYYSVMNYIWQYPQPGFPPSYWRLDYSHVKLADLVESTLDESVGIEGSDPDFAAIMTPYGTGGEPPALGWAKTNGDPVDWNGSGGPPDPGTVAVDINYHFQCLDPPVPCPSPDQTLTGHADWPNLHYALSGDPNFSDGVHNLTSEDTEMTLEVFEQMSAIPPPTGACFADLDGDGLSDLVDFSVLHGCMNGPGQLPGPGCAAAHMDGDGDVDLADFGMFQAAFDCP